MSTLLTNMPTWLLGVIVVGGSMLLAAVGLLLARPRVKSIITEEHNDIAGFIFAAIGAVYGVLLAFLVFAVWDDFGSAQRAAAQEASILLSLYHDTHAFPQPVRSITKRQLHEYAHSVVDDEWKTMEKGDPSPRTQAQLDALYHDYGRLKPANSWETALYSESFSRLNDMSADRDLRVLSSQAALADIFWVVLIGGAVLTVGFSFLFYMQNIRVQVLLTALEAGLIALVLFLILVLNHPFTGDVRVSPESFDYALHVMDITPP